VHGRSLLVAVLWAWQPAFEQASAFKPAASLPGWPVVSTCGGPCRWPHPGRVQPRPNGSLSRLGNLAQKQLASKHCCNCWLYCWSASDGCGRQWSARMEALRFTARPSHVIAIKRLSTLLSAIAEWFWLGEPRGALALLSHLDACRAVSLLGHWHPPADPVS